MQLANADAWNQGSSPVDDPTATAADLLQAKAGCEVTTILREPIFQYSCVVLTSGAQGFPGNQCTQTCS